MRRIRTLALAALPAICPPPHAAAQQPPQNASPAGAARGPARIEATTGAAPGYVEDNVCAACHAEIYQAYQQTGMARSFSKPGPQNVIEEFTRNRGEHKPSRRHYQMIERDGRYVFKRFQVDADGNDINVFERQVDWILGSGDHSRTYLYQTNDGELYQLPLAWYEQEKIWYMAPGYDRPDHDGLTRSVQRECMFCHNGYPEAAADSDRYGYPPRFPKELPRGIGCQRCHGPGGEHVRAAMREGATAGRLRETIVNPGRLDPQRRADVCDQCHLQPIVSLFGTRRFGKGTYSYRPGEALSDYIVQMEATENDRPAPERFEINHHPYRLRQSACFKGSAGALECLTCHDPHRNVPPEQSAKHYRAACLGCHGTATLGALHSGVAWFSPESDCVACHMPRRRTQDVVHVTMTDHLIARRPGGAGLIEPLKEREPSLTGIELYNAANGPTGDEANNYRAVTVLRAMGHRYKQASDLLERNVAAVPRQEPDLYLDLAMAQMRERRFEDARKNLAKALALDPANPRALVWTGSVEISLGRPDKAIEHFEGLLKDNPNHPDALYNYGLALIGQGRHADAVPQFQRAVELRENLVEAWYALGSVNLRLERLDQAAAGFKRALEIRPEATGAYVGIAQALAASGNRDEALRYLNHGLQVAAQREPIAAALDKLKAPARGN